jgi:hypothetical protein
VIISPAELKMQPTIHLQGKPEYGHLGLLWRCIVGCIFNFSLPSGSLSLGKYPRQLFSSEILVHVNLEEMGTTGECTRITNHTTHFNNVYLAGSGSCRNFNLLNIRRILLQIGILLPVYCLSKKKKNTIDVNKITR